MVHWKPKLRTPGFVTPFPRTERLPLHQCLLSGHPAFFQVFCPEKFLVDIILLQFSMDVVKIRHLPVCDLLWPRRWKKPFCQNCICLVFSQRPTDLHFYGPFENPIDGFLGDVNTDCFLVTVFPDRDFNKAPAGVFLSRGTSYTHTHLKPGILTPFFRSG